jgi:hypothetical protein
MLHIEGFKLCLQINFNILASKNMLYLIVHTKLWLQRASREETTLDAQEGNIKTICDKKR